MCLNVVITLDPDAELCYETVKVKPCIQQQLNTRCKVLFGAIKRGLLFLNKIDQILENDNKVEYIIKSCRIGWLDRVVWIDVQRV